MDETKAYMDKERETINYALRSGNVGKQTTSSPVNGYAMEGDSPRRSTLRERIDSTLRQAQSTYQRAGAAQRAKEIIEQHPEFAELLDLLNQF